MSGAGTAHRAAFAAALALALAAPSARAHDQPFSYLELRLDGTRASGAIMAHVADLAGAAGIAEADSLLSDTGRSTARPALEREVLRRLRVRADGESLSVTFTSGPELQRSRPLLRWTFRATLSRPAAVVRIEGPLFPEDPQHQTFLDLYENGTLRREDVLDAGHRACDHFTGTAQGTRAVVRAFVLQGIRHIFIGPDHILFILGLLLLGGRLTRLLKIITAFTLAHSLTLALATMGIVNPPPRLVEIAIAASIVCVGAENLLAERGGRDLRAALAFAFGLVHGFGFASVLAEFGLPKNALAASLFAFNAGVEVGQACIVLVAAPALAWIAARGPRPRARLVRGGSFVVIAVGAYWLVQRVIAR